MCQLTQVFPLLEIVVKLFSRSEVFLGTIVTVRRVSFRRKVAVVEGGERRKETER